jgi:hypothetical protein
LSPRKKVAGDPDGILEGRSIGKRTFNLGIGGTIERNEDDPATPAQSRVRFEAEADVGAVKAIFKPNNRADLATILTVDADTFHILEVTEKEPDPELPLDGEGEGGE